MPTEIAEGLEERAEAFLARIGRHLRDVRKRASFALYFFGLLGDGERKSAEPIAARACGDPQRARATHEQLLHFLGRSRWDDRAVRREAVRYALEAMPSSEPATVWIVDDTGFLKQGSHSVGVQRQYTGSAGKTANCQIGVSLAVATQTHQLPLDFELYLPRSWTDDPARCQQARVPQDVTFKTKIDLALGMIARAAENGIPGDTVLADAAFGEACDFRDTLRVLGFDYAVAVSSKTHVQLEPGEPLLRVDQIAKQVGPRAFRLLSWREGTRKTLRSRFAFRRVRAVQNDGVPLEQREPVWLLMEWPEGEERPSQYYLTTLPRRMSKKQIVRTLKERWRTERMYEDLKGEFGLDHFEGRSYPGWHHHVSVVLCSYAFAVAERARHFPPTARRSSSSPTLVVAA
jgi:SRSO17 transposase